RFSSIEGATTKPTNCLNNENEKILYFSITPVRIRHRFGAGGGSRRLQTGRPTAATAALGRWFLGSDWHGGGFLSKPPRGPNFFSGWSGLPFIRRHFYGL